MMMKLSQNDKNLRKPAFDERNRGPHVPGAKPYGHLDQNNACN